MFPTGNSGFPKSHNGPWGGSALKPAWEPIVLARKPLDGTHASNYEKHGVGGLNIDAARVPLAGDTVPEFGGGKTDTEKYHASRASWLAGQETATSSFGLERRGGEKPWKARVKEDGSKGTTGFQMGGRGNEEGSDLGRWPANVVHDGSEAVVGEFPHGVSGANIEDSPSRGSTSIFGFGGVNHTQRHASEGSAARFFYAAKPSRGEKEAGLHEFSRDLKPAIKRKVEADLTLTDATCDYTCGGTTPRANTHATVKPIELMRWLVRLLSRPGQVVLDPFLGSGTTAIACVLEGREWIGVEKDEDYARIARARIEWWRREYRRKPGRTVAQILGEGPRVAPKPKRGEEQQETLF